MHHAPRFVSIALSFAVCGSLVFTSGCGKSKATNAQTPPPPTLSEPVRPIETTPAQSPTIPASSNEDYAAQKTGESRELPAVTAQPPARATAPMPVAPATQPAAGRYHTLAKGETLYAVARMYNVKPKELIQVNNFRDPNRLSVGTKVYIP